MKEKRHIILEKIQANGGFWSYQGIPESLDEDAVNEAAFVWDMEQSPYQADLERTLKDSGRTD